MSNKKELVVKLRAFKGKKTYTKAGEIDSENQTISMYHGRIEWSNFLESAKYMYTSLEIVSVQEEVVVTIVKEDFQGKKYNDRKTTYKAIEVPEGIKKEVSSAIGGAKSELTADQKEIAELKAQMAEFLKGKKEPKAKKLPSNTSDVDQELEAAKATYEEVFKKKPNALMKLETLNNKIREELNK